MAVVFIGALTGSRQFIGPQLAVAPKPAVPVEPLMVALNTPVVEIPKAEALEEPAKRNQHQQTKDSVH